MADCLWFNAATCYRTTPTADTECLCCLLAMFNSMNAVKHQRANKLTLKAGKGVQ